jgi:hypothetical protein
MPLLIDITVAILLTKIPILLGHGYGPFHLPSLNRYGVWSMASEARADFSMLVGLLFLLAAGPGAVPSIAVASSRWRCAILLKIICFSVRQTAPASARVGSA